MSKLLDQVRDLMRVRHYSLRTEESYLRWIREYILFHNKRHPAEMGEQEVTAFLTHLAVKRNVAASTQTQALSAVLLLYRDVLKQPLEWLIYEAGREVKNFFCSERTPRLCCRLDGNFPSSAACVGL